jgi:hypothetical protein
MGVFDALLGRSKASKPAKQDRLFALSTAYITMQADQGVVTTGTSAIVFQALATGDFRQIVSEMEEVVKGTGDETGTTVSTSDDEFGYRWMVLKDPDVEDLVVGVNAVSDALAVGGYADRVLCAVFAFTDSDKKPLYMIYNYKRGTWYPFIPEAGDKQRSTERELQLKAVIGAEMPIEPELERWFPLWGIPI